MAEFGWAYVKGGLTASGPTGSIQFRGNDTDGMGSLTGSANFTFSTGTIINDPNGPYKLFLTGTLNVLGNTSLDGNLVVLGTTTTISASNLIVKDPVIGLGFGTGAAHTGAAGDRGFIFGIQGNNNQAMLWDNSSASFIVGKVGAEGPHGEGAGDAAFDMDEGDYGILKVGGIRASGSGEIFGYKLVSSGDIFVSGAATFNEAGGASDFRVEGANDTHLLFVDASEDAVSIGVESGAPTALLEIAGDAAQAKPTLEITHAEDTNNAVNIVADAVTTANVIDVTADALTSGKVIKVESTSNNLNGAVLFDINATGTSTNAYTVAKITKDASNASDSNAIIGLDIDFDAAAGTAARALRIDSEQTTGIVAEINADQVTTGTGIHVSADELTTGKALQIISNSDSTGTRDLVLIHNDHEDAVNTRLLHIMNDAVGATNTVTIESTVAETNPLLELKNSNAATDKPAILAFNRSDGSAEADDMSLGTLKFLGVDSGDASTEYASIEAIASDVTATDEGGKLLFNVMASGTLGHAAASKTLLSIGGEDAANSTRCAVVVNDDSTDSDFRVESNDETHMFFVDGATNRIGIGDNSGTPNATLEVKNNASAGATGVPLVQLNSNDTDEIALDINAGNIDANVVEILANAVTTAKVINVSADGLTTGNAIRIDDNSSDTGTRKSALIIQNHASAIAATALHVQSDGGITGIELDKNFSSTSAASVTGFKLDFDKTGASTTDNTLIGAQIDMDNTTATAGENSMIGIQVTPTLTHANDAGITTVIGAEITATGHTNGASQTTGSAIQALSADANVGVHIITTDGTLGEHNADIVIASSADEADKCYIGVGASGATTIATVDSDASAANLTFTVDGAINHNAVGLITLDGLGVEIANDGAAPALLIDNDIATQVALDIDADNTTANVIDIAATALTTGKALFIDAGNATTTSTTAGAIVHIDFDKTGVVASGQTSTFKGLEIDMGDAASNVGVSTTMTGIDIGLVNENAGGGAGNICLNLSGSGGATNYGLRTLVDDAATSADILMLSSLNPSADYGTISVRENGAMTVTTVDGSAALADLTFTVDGAITQTAAGLIKLDGLGTEIENDGAAPALLIDNNTVDQIALQIAAVNTTVPVVQIEADSVTTGAGLFITADALTTGAALSVASTSTHTGGASALVKFHSDDERGHDSNAHIGLFLDFDSTAGAAAKALYIDSEQTTGIVIDTDASAITTGKAQIVRLGNMTTGIGLKLDHNDSSTADAVTPKTLHVDFDKTGVAWPMRLNRHLCWTEDRHERCCYR